MVTSQIEIRWFLCLGCSLRVRITFYFFLQPCVLETNAETLFCIIQHPLPAGHCQIPSTLKEFFAAFFLLLLFLFFFPPVVRELFIWELQLPVQPASRRGPPHVLQPFTGWLPLFLHLRARLGTSGLSLQPVTHARAVNMYVGVGGSLTLWKRCQQAAAVSMLAAEHGKNLLSKLWAANGALIF